MQRKEERRRRRGGGKDAIMAFGELARDGDYRSCVAVKNR